MNINKYFINNLNEILILKIPNNILDKNKIYYDLLLYYELDNIKVKYKNNIISKNELKNLIYNNKYIKKYYYFTV